MISISNLSFNYFQLFSIIFEISSAFGYHSLSMSQWSWLHTETRLGHGHHMSVAGPSLEKTRTNTEGFSRNGPDVLYERFLNLLLANENCFKDFNQKKTFINYFLHDELHKDIQILIFNRGRKLVE